MNKQHEIKHGLFHFPGMAEMILSQLHLCEWP